MICISALKEPPRITGISNTTDGCIETLWSPPKSPKLTALNYKVTVRYFDSDTKREFHTKVNTVANTFYKLYVQN